MSETAPTRVDGAYLRHHAADCDVKAAKESSTAAATFLRGCSLGLRWGADAADRLTAQVAEQQGRIDVLQRHDTALYTVMPCGHQQMYTVAASCLLCQVAEQAQEIAAKETMIAATDAEAVKALLLLTDAEAKLREQAQEIERLRREWEDAVERERRLAPSLADTQMMARDAQAKLRAVEALRDNLSITYQATLNIWPKEISERLTAILTCDGRQA